MVFSQVGGGPRSSVPRGTNPLETVAEAAHIIHSVAESHRLGKGLLLHRHQPTTTQNQHQKSWPLVVEPRPSGKVWKRRTCWRRLGSTPSLEAMAATSASPLS